ncbi:MAG: sulfatase-like hydrolase/transferase [Cytophagales bacterium]|nr:sulfatase-like hydrolase/transferase [Cytophagales bacterium]
MNLLSICNTKSGFIPGLLLIFITSCGLEKETATPPNVLWIVSEDNGPFLGCYGDEFATTPTLDKLASEGVLYENAFANAPVCAPARSTIITGMYPPSLGTQNMRSTYPIPDSIKFFTQYLRAAGYYCTNNAKEDYNMSKPEGTWDESSREAHYKNRTEGQPFFAIFNIGISHESSIHESTPTRDLRHDPACVKLPPYHPDTPDMRHDWAQYYDKIEDMDVRVDEILGELEEAGLAETTIVAYYSDHAGVIARSKRFVYESGTHVPMIWRFPEKYRHLAPGNPGDRTDRLVSFVDLAPTMLSLAGVEIPGYMQGKAFLGKQQTVPRAYVHLFRGRMDERMDKVRAVRDKQFRYIKNYMPHRIYGQYIQYLWRAPSCRSWEEAYLAGTCNKAQSAFWEEKPAEELYDVTADPWEVNNLADNPQYADVLARMRDEADRWMTEIKDTGLMPEGEMSARSREQPLFTYTRSGSYDFEKIKQAADIATLRDASKLDEIIALLSDEHPTVRYWGAIGCLILKEKAMPAKEALKNALNDESPDVRISAAEALCHLGESELAIQVFIDALNSKNMMVRVHAMNSLEIIGNEVAKASIPKVKQVIASRDYDIRAGMRLIELYGG